MGWTIGVSNPGTGKRLIASPQYTGQFWGAYTASYPVNTRGSLPLLKAAGV